MTRDLAKIFFKEAFIDPKKLASWRREWEMYYKDTFTWQDYKELMIEEQLRK